VHFPLIADLFVIAGSGRFEPKVVFRRNGRLGQLPDLLSLQMVMFWVVFLVVDMNEELVVLPVLMVVVAPMGLMLVLVGHVDNPLKVQSPRPRVVGQRPSIRPLGRQVGNLVDTVV
jgi:hypothetical protein